MPTFETPAGLLKEVLRYLKTEARPRFRRLDDLTAVDESARRQPSAAADFSLVYQLLSFEPAGRLRLKVPLRGDAPHSPTVTDIWPSANWYER
ncbi:MAG: NADH-quinone oxidoreductase subunit C, partial [Desulfobacterales bacterium]